MEVKNCQSCGMPMTSEEQWGTCADGSRSEEYCCYCYQKGAFVQECTMDEMIEHCLKFLDEFNSGIGQKMTVEEARSGMRQFFPTLKRWKK